MTSDICIIMIYMGAFSTLLGLTELIYEIATRKRK